MVQLGTNNKVRRSVRHRDFAPITHRAPVVTKKLSKAYHHKSLPRWRYWLWMSLGLFIFGFILAFAYSPIFTIKNIVVNNIEFKPTEDRLREILREAMSKKRWYILPQSNLVFFSKKRAQNILASEFYIEDVTFSRHWPNVLKVNVANNVIVSIWQASNGEFLMDRRGMLVQQLSEVSADTSSLPLIYEQNSPARNLGDSVISADLAIFIDRLYDKWKSDLPNLLPQKILVDSESLPTIQAYMTDGWYVNISAESTAEPQVESLKRLMEERIKDDRSKLQYIDVRFGNRLYFKLK